MVTNDELLQILREARVLFQARNTLNQVERKAVTRRLSERNFFSIGQLAQLSGYSPATLYGIVEAQHRGYGSGRFNPFSLDTMIQTVLNKSSGLPVTPFMISAMVKDGNSRRVIAKMTGLQTSAISRVMEKMSVDHSSGVQ